MKLVYNSSKNNKIRSGGWEMGNGKGRGHIGTWWLIPPVNKLQSTFQ